MAVFLLVHAFAFLMLALTCYVAGAALLLAGGLAPESGGSPLEVAALALPLGFLAVGQLGLLLGLLGWLRPAPSAAALLALHALAWRGWRLLLGQARWALRRLAPAAAAGLALAAAPFAVLSLYPPTAFDATLYHLLFARQFAATGGLPFLRNLRYPIFPQLQEVMSALVMLFADDVAAQGVTLLATLGTALLLVAWGSRRAGSPQRAAGGLAAAAFLGCPIVAALAATAYVEPAMTWLGTAALYALWRWRRGAAPGGAGWLALAGALAGGAAAVKYLGLAFVAAVAAGALAAPAGPSTCGGREGGAWAGVGVRLRLALLACAGAAAVIAPWYLRILVATGNPLFPYFPDLFGGSPWVAHEFPGFRGLGAAGGRVLGGLVRLPWDMVVARQRLGAQPPYSPYFLLLLPLLAVAALRRRRVRRLLLLAAAYAVLVLALLPEARYLLPLAPLLALAVGETVAGWLGGVRRAGRIAVAAGLLLFLPGWLYAGYRVARYGPLPVTAGARDAFLRHVLPVYAAVDFLNRSARPYTVYALHAENMAYFAAGNFLGDWSGPAAFGAVVPADGDPRRLRLNLNRLGAGYLLLVRGKTAPVDSGDPAFQGLFHRVYADGSAEVFALAGGQPAAAAASADAWRRRGR